ncbi:MAG: tyrosine--tRNA ligase [Actinobacteria bacterium RBG_16_64_13]|nr:MAG: tyrosine--tRNA ligase [Actinobacteria bacterium RBG_16_64_13]
MDGEGMPPEIPADVRDEYEELLPGSVDVLPDGELVRQLQRARSEQRPLRVKLGVDPTAPDIHLGHTVVLRKLAQFQAFGHTAVLIIGDYTAKVGDPSGRSKSRPRLSDEEINVNAATYVEQAAKVLDMDKAELVRNGDWLGPLRMNEVLNLTATVTVARMLERDDFSRRYLANEPVSMLEFMYPLLQGYDSVAVRADIELGGTDQKFNLLMGRTIMEAYGLTPQSILTVPLLVGTDGEQKMSKSYGNYIGVSESAEEMFGKVMSIPDSLMVTYWRLLTGAGKLEVQTVERRLAEGGYHPAEAKRDLAERLVTLYHSSGAATAARSHFDRVFKERDRPEIIPEASIPSEVIQNGSVWLPRLLTALGLASSNGEAKRLIEQGGVRLDDAVLQDASAELAAAELAGSVLQVGKRRFLRLI